MATANKNTGNRKYEKGMRRWSQEERENIVANKSDLN